MLAPLKAPDLLRLIEGILQELGVPLTKLVGFTADGASVMGTRRAFGLPGSNVAKLLQDKILSAGGLKLIVVHCSAHRLGIPQF